MTDELLNFGELVCTETLVACLRDEHVLKSGVERKIYVTSKQFGKEGSTGLIRQGDFASDVQAKIIAFDTSSDTFVVIRNGNPPPPPEHVPDGDVGALVRSFVRCQSSVQPVVVTVTDAERGGSKETIRKVIKANQIEMLCEHGPDPSARNVPYCVNVPETAVSPKTLALVGVLLVSAWVAYAKYWRDSHPPGSLPATKPLLVGKLSAENHMVARDVRSTLRRARE